jgi:hypothetical protein
MSEPDGVVALSDRRTSLNPRRVRSKIAWRVR